MLTKKNSVISNKASDVVVMRRDEMPKGMRYAISIRPTNPALRRVVFLNIYLDGRKATCSSPLDMVEKTIVHSFVKRITRGQAVLLGV